MPDLPPFMSAACLDEEEHNDWAKLSDELRRTEADLTVAVHEATRARTELRSEKATTAELRRQLAGTGALLGAAVAQRQAALDVCQKVITQLPGMGRGAVAMEIRAALGAAGTGRTA